MCYPWWQHHEAAVVTKMLHLTEQHMFLVINLHNIIQTLLRPKQSKVLCALSTRDIVCCNNTVIIDHYVHVLQKEFLPFLLGMGINFGENFFQEDRAWPHTANAVLNCNLLLCPKRWSPLI
jgi:hypothetical protein